jgi:hypothetical protein
MLCLGPRSSVIQKHYFSVLCAMFRWQTVGCTRDRLRDSPNKSERQLITIHQWVLHSSQCGPPVRPPVVA